MSGPFLEMIDPAVRKRLRDAMSIRNYEPGSFVLTEDEDGDDVFFVLAGRARATSYASDGKTVAYREIGSGEIFGELAAIDGTARAASVVAQETLVAGSLSGPAFRRFVEAEPALMWALLRYLTAQSRRMTQRIFEYSTMVVKERLVHELIRLAKAVAGDRNEALLEPSPTHFDLAAAISTHREAVSREMSRLAKQDLLKRTPDGLMITDIARLEALVRSEIEARSD